MTDREVMKMALYALMDANKFEYKDEIAALRTALAQPEQEPVACGYDETVGLCTNNPCCEQAQPEPPFQLTDAGVDTNIPLWGLEPKGEGMVALHQREWVGLTNDEIQTQWNNACLDTVENPGWNRHIRFARTIEAKLKEKNT